MKWASIKTYERLRHPVSKLEPDRLVNDIVGNAGDELTVIATDAQGATNLYTIPIKLCICENGGSCTYTSNMGGTQNYQVLKAL